MKLVIGLGNPGKEYEKTRHNVGHVVVDELKKHKSTNLQIYKSTNFMNDSGSFVSSLTKRYSLDPNNLFVIHDDLDILLGSYKIQLGKGPKDHNGLASIDLELETNQYWHVRVGVDNRPLDNRPMGEEYVLQNFTDEEEKILEKTIKEVVNKLISIFHDQ